MTCDAHDWYHDGVMARVDGCVCRTCGVRARSTANLGREKSAENAALDVIRSYLEEALPFLGITAPEQVREAVCALEARIIWTGSSDAANSVRCRVKTGWLTGKAYCAIHGRDAGWPCTAARFGRESS